VGMLLGLLSGIALTLLFLYSLRQPRMKSIPAWDPDNQEENSHRL